MRDSRNAFTNFVERELMSQVRDELGSDRVFQSGFRFSGSMEKFLEKQLSCYFSV